MRKRILLAGLVLWIIAAGRLCAAAEPPTDDQKLPVLLGRLPELKLIPRPPLTNAQARHIKDLIASFAALDKPDFGLSATMGGTSFAPVPGQEQALEFLLTDHGLSTNSALKELVAIGPDAMPFLLDALDDQTPTRLVIEQPGAAGAMWLSNELHLNPVNPFEQATYKLLGGKQPKELHSKSCTIKIGDVCFVALGQIVGRAYSAVRYQPSACIVVNSTTHDAQLCAQVRSIWKSPDARQRLFESLRTDYSTFGISSGEGLDEWDVGNGFQCEAALRLLFYFPKESVTLLAHRLDGLNVSADADLEGFVRRTIANGVRSEDFIKAVAWSSDPAIRKSLTALFARSDDVPSALAALPVVQDKKLIRHRLEVLLSRLLAHQDDSETNANESFVLSALAHGVPDAARPLFDRYLKDRTPQRCGTVCYVLRGERVSWDIDLLLPLLSDQRPTGDDYAIVPGQNEPRLPIRVCDEAAITLSQNHHELSFTQAGQYADLDRQIAAMRTRLAKMSVKGAGV